MFLSGMYIYFMEKFISANILFAICFVFLLLLFDDVLFYKIIGLASGVFLWGLEINPKYIYTVTYLMSFPFFIFYLGAYSKPVLKIKKDISYGLYIYGWPVSQAIIYVFNKLQIDLNIYIFIFLSITLSIVMAYLSWVLIESKFILLKNKVEYFLQKKIAVNHKVFQLKLALLDNVIF